MANRCAVLWSFVLVLGTLINTAAGAEGHMRREARQSVSLEPGGELIGLRARFHAKRGQMPSTCNINYPLGNINKNNCTANHPTHKLIDNPWLCEMAAEEARARSPNPEKNNTDDSFYVLPPWDKTRPKGCFKTQDDMFYFNPCPLFPKDDDVKGTPICYEPEFLNATDDAKCPEGYAAIHNEATCREAAQCLGHCTERHFRIVNATKGDQLAGGCHYHPETGCLQYNPTKAPKTPTGIQLCNITIKYPHAGTL